ncbi:MAG: hypothetical protein ACO323_03780 [Candidatus Kapaibacteriota bacterium]
MNAFRYILTICSFLCSAFAFPLFGQTDTKGQKAPELKYALRVDFKENVYASYVMDEKTTVNRMYRDSISKQYQRKLQYNFTQSPESPKSDGLPLVTNIDSMKYAFMDGPTQLLYDSQNPKAATVNTEFPDAISNMALLNHQFVLVYSPQTEVVNVRGVDQPGDIEWLRNYIINEGKDALDTAQRFTWLNALTDEQAAWIGDVSKELISGKMVIAPDSVWKRGIRLRLDGIDFIDTVEVRVSAYSKGEYVVEAVSKALKPVTSNDARFFGVPAPVPIQQGEGQGTIIMEMNSSGWVKKVTLKYNAKVTAQYKREQFTQDINTETTWTLLGRYKWN